MAISWETAYKIKIADYWETDTFLKLCAFPKAKQLVQNKCFDALISIPDYKEISVPPQGIVKMADKANSCQKQVEDMVPSMQFVLTFYTQFVPFQVIADAAFQLMIDYNAAQTHTAKADEKGAAAAILMLLFGEELRKLQLLRMQVLLHHERVAYIQDSQPVVIRRLATIEEYLRYHIDLVDEKDGTMLRAYQFEKNETYFQLLDFSQKQSASNGSLYARHWLDENRRQSNLFLDEVGCELLQMVYRANAGKQHIHAVKKYTRVEDIGL